MDGNGGNVHRLTKIGAANLPKNLRIETVSADGKHVHVLAREPGWFADAGAPVTQDGKRILVAVG